MISTSLLECGSSPPPFFYPLLWNSFFLHLAATLGINPLFKTLKGGELNLMNTSLWRFTGSKFLPLAWVIPIIVPIVSQIADSLTVCVHIQVLCPHQSTVESRTVYSSDCSTYDLQEEITSRMLSFGQDENWKITQ